jgi:hypothetical protein
MAIPLLLNEKLRKWSEAQPAGDRKVASAS